MRSPLILGAVALALGGCPKRGGPARGSAGGTVAVSNRIPTQCTAIRKEESARGAETFEPAGCLAEVRFHLSPSGVRDVRLPNFRDAAVRESLERVTEGRVTSRTLMLHDPAGERLWSVHIPEDALPWEPSGTCVRAEPLSRFDMQPWHLLVVRVLTRDAYGTPRPIAEVQSDTLALTLHPPGSDPIEPVLVPSSTHDGVWAAVWCGGETGARMEVTLDVRGAYQLEVDTFSIPDVSRDTYTVLEYVVEPIPGGGL